jgi:hypothetical protein
MATDEFLSKFRSSCQYYALNLKSDLLKFLPLRQMSKTGAEIMHEFMLNIGFVEKK